MTSTRTIPMIYRQLALASTSDAITQLEAVVDEISQELDFKDDAYANIMVAVTEAVNNAVIHGNKSDASKKVYVEFEIPSKYRLLIRIHDQGNGFDPETLADPTAPENLEKIGGRGIFLMKHLADVIDFSEEGRQVEMIFNI